MNKKITLPLLIIIFSSFILSACSSSQSKPISTPEPTPETQAEEHELTPEEVIENLSTDSKITGDMTAEITSPEEETFSQSQARMWEVEVENQPTNTRIFCHWEFFLNQYDQEELYEQMDSCKFTSTFIKNRGELRVVVTTEAINTVSKEVIASSSAQREFLVQ